MVILISKALPEKERLGGCTAHVQLRVLSGQEQKFGENITPSTENYPSLKYLFEQKLSIRDKHTGVAV